MAAILDFQSEQFSLLFLSTNPRDASYQVSSQKALRFRRRSEKKIFKMAATEVILNLQLERLAVFDLQVTPMIPTKFQVNWPFNSGEQAKEKKKKKEKKVFKMATTSWISDRNDFSNF